MVYDLVSEWVEEQIVNKLFPNKTSNHHIAFIKQCPFIIFGFKNCLRYMTIEQLSKKIRIQIYDSVWIDEDEDVFMQKTDGIIEDKISDYLRDLVDEGYIKCIKPRET